MKDLALPRRESRSKNLHIRNLMFLVYFRYCVNILTYVMFKTKQVNLKLHPLTKRIVEFKQMLEEMAELDEKMAPKVQHLITSTPEIVPERKSTKKKSSKKKLKILDKVKEKTSKETIEKDGKSYENCEELFAISWSPIIK